MRKCLLVLLLPLVLVLAPSAWGATKRAEADTARLVKCKGPALAKAPNLPKGFPKPREVTYTAARQAGPSLIVTGYFAADLTEALAEYKVAVTRAHYTNLKTERDPHDAEIAFKGGGTTGQIALRETCNEGETTFVQITARPESAPQVSLTKLQGAATDLVHETANSDAPGSGRALKELEAEFDKVKVVLETKTPAQEKTIDHTIEAVKAALKAGDSKKAYAAAKVILAAVNTAAAKLGGSQSSAITKLQTAAADLVREADHKDATGARRALRALETEFHRVQKLLIAKAPAQEKTIDHTIEKVESALGESNWEEALGSAKSILKAAEAAAKRIAAGQQAAKGLEGAIEELKAASSELDNEARFKDKEGLQRAFDEFHAIYTENKARIAARSPKARDIIHAAMENVEKAIPGGNFTKIRITTKALIAAVNTAAKTLGV